MKKYLNTVVLVIPITLAVYFAFIFSGAFYDGFLWAFFNGNGDFGNWFENERGFAKAAYVISISSFVIVNFAYFCMGIRVSLR